MNANDYAAKRNERTKKKKAAVVAAVPHQKKYRVVRPPGERSPRKCVNIAKEERRQNICAIVRAMYGNRKHTGPVHDISRRVRRYARGEM